jgi:hypothetical protein
MGSGALNFQGGRITANWAVDQQQVPQITYFEDFLGDTIDLTARGLTVTNTGTPGATFDISTAAGDPVAGHGGWAAGTTEAIDASAIEVAVMGNTAAGQFRADRATSGRPLVFEARVSIPTALTARIMNVGFSDDETEGAAMAMSLSTATWTTTASDAALWTYSSLATDDDNWIGQTVDTDVDGTHLASGIAAVADTATVLRVELDSAGVAFFHQDGEMQGAVAAGVTETVGLIPYVAWGSTTTTAVPFEIDYIFATVPR